MTFFLFISFCILLAHVPVRCNGEKINSYIFKQGLPLSQHRCSEVSMGLVHGETHMDRRGGWHRLIIGLILYWDVRNVDLRLR